MDRFNIEVSLSQSQIVLFLVGLAHPDAAPHKDVRGTGHVMYRLVDPERKVPGTSDDALTYLADATNGEIDQLGDLLI